MSKLKLHETISAYKKLAKDLERTPRIKDIHNHLGISENKLRALGGHNSLCRKAGLTPNRNTKESDKIDVYQGAPKIFCFDLEVLALVVKTYGLYNQNIRPSRIVNDWSILSWAGKFLDEKEIYYYDTREEKNVRNDKSIVKKLHTQLNKADIILGHNSDRYDIKKINAKFLQYGLKPVHFSKQIDTLKIARKYFKITSNRLDFIAKFLGLTPKRITRKFSSNEEMWDECEKGNIEAFKENKKYNIQDVETTIEVFDKLKAWDQSLNFQSYYGRAVCVCGCDKFIKKGFRYTKQGAYQRYACDKCGKKYSGKENLIDKDDRKLFLK